MKQRNKRLIISSCLLLTLIFIVHLFIDDELNPEAQKWINHYSQKPNLEQNAFIELIALGISDENPYHTAKQKYLTAEQKFNNGEFDYDGQLKYPVIAKLPSLVNNPTYCTFEKPDCFAQLDKNKETILNKLQPIKDELKKFRQLISYTNFDRLNSLATKPSVEMLSLYQLSGIQAYYMITAG